MMYGEHEDVELGEREDDAFISNRPHVSKDYYHSGHLMRCIPLSFRTYLQNLSRLKLVVILVVSFLVMLLMSNLYANLPIKLKIPGESVKMVKQVAEIMGNTSVPLYVMAYAPIVVLDKGDLYYPSDLASHVANTHPTVNFTSIEGVPSPLSLVNLDSLNALGGDNVYLTSTHNVLKLPKFINGKKPDARTLQTKDAISSVIICVDKGNGILDAFYIYFYSFNEGPVAIGHRIGNHLGDWEHNMVRFQDGKPVAVWFSQHEYGDAYTYEAVQKVNNRPIVFSARGSHANYAKVGKHDLHDQDEKIPKRIVYDHTSYGPLWDPTLSAYYYTFSMNSKELFPGMDDMPVSFLNFQGWWGDQQYGDDIVGQEWYYGFYKWTGGPQGPIFKHLDRQDVCLPSRPVCIIKKHI